MLLTLFHGIAMAKHPFPIPNLMAAAAQAGMYNVDTVQKPILLMPQGMLDLVKYTRELQFCPLLFLKKQCVIRYKLQVRIQ